MLAGAVALLIAGSGGAAPRGAKPPRLAVLIAVDQLRADLLDRYDPLFAGGFRRLRDSGLRFASAVVDHGLTNSLPGHVTLASGAYPSRHGIVNGAWAEKAGEKIVRVEGQADDASPIVGFPKLPGASPRKVLVDGIADWFLAADPQARVVAVGTGEYSSLLHAGHTRGLVYWFSPDAGRYVTSRYYRAADPAWITRFQETAIPELFGHTVWQMAFPPRGSQADPPDAEPSEFDGVHTTFPHRFAEERDKELKEDRLAQADWLYFTPMPDATTLRLAEEAVRQEKLGRRPGHVDYLSIVVSAVDHVGHRFGPGSLEQLDNDRRVPLIFFGAGIGAGAFDAPARTVDVAPTLAWLSRIPAGPGIDGHPLPLPGVR